MAANSLRRDKVYRIYRYYRREDSQVGRFNDSSSETSKGTVNTLRTIIQRFVAPTPTPPVTPDDGDLREARDRLARVQERDARLKVIAYESQVIKRRPNE